MRLNAIQEQPFDITDWQCSRSGHKISHDLDPVKQHISLHLSGVCDNDKNTNKSQMINVLQGRAW